MKKLDVAVQSLLIWPIIILFLVSAINIESRPSLLVILCLQLLLGPWQVLSSLIRLIIDWQQRQKMMYKYLLIYTALVTTYFMLLLFLPSIGSGTSILIYAVIPTAIGIYYYYLSFLSLRQNSHPRLSSFLPHTSF